ncbi:hypothetical protein BV22DRAFT_1032267 [Leucogyrophana mollusca]|uniref:Uncharacterized protein n=1 Tax=Leucogyrophana mollusca TaxID=85980 RepID=A0ACB8BNF5_9AGAM|nr:hypothetical protein BV22DRAFT_1032267 [Leucogyrophana mollusca]
MPRPAKEILNHTDEWVLGNFLRQSSYHPMHSKTVIVGLLAIAGVAIAGCTLPPTSKKKPWSFNVYSNYDCGHNATGRHFEGDPILIPGCTAVCQQFGEGINGVLGAFAFNAPKKPAYHAFIYSDTDCQNPHNKKIEARTVQSDTKGHGGVGIKWAAFRVCMTQ